MYPSPRTLVHLVWSLTKKGRLCAGIETDHPNSSTRAALEESDPLIQEHCKNLSTKLIVRDASTICGNQAQRSHTVSTLCLES